MQKTRNSAVISRGIKMEFVDSEGATATIATDYHYRPTDPFAVTVVFKGSGEPVSWTFSRDLLVDGLYAPAGQGDVQVWPCLSSTGAAVVILELASPDGEVLVQAPSRAVHEFVTEMLASVPVGTELSAVDLDDELFALLG